MAATGVSVDLGAMYGPLLLGIILSGILYGITSLQSIYFFNHYGTRDRWVLKGLISVLWFLDSFVMALQCQGGYYYFVIAFGDTSAFGRRIWSFDLESLLTGLITFLCQMFFVIRIRKLCRGLYPRSQFAVWIFYFLSVLAAVGLITSIAMTVIVFSNPAWVAFETKMMQALLIANIVVVTVLDVFITIILCIILHRQRGDINSTNSLINRLMRFMITRGIATTTLQTVLLITYLSMPNNSVWTAFHLVTSKIYANAVLTTLNSRTPAGVVGKSNTEVSGDIWKHHGNSSCTTETAMSFTVQPQVVSGTTVIADKSRV